MIDLNRKPKKSQQEQEFDALNSEYIKAFGEPYVFDIGFPASWDEVLEDIKNCLTTGKPQKKPKYEEDMTY